MFSLASDDADDDLLPKAFRVTHFFYVDSNPRVLNHLFFDDGGKPSAVPIVIGSYYSGLPRSTYGKRKALRDGIDHSTKIKTLTRALRRVSARSMAELRMTLKLSWAYVQARQQRQLHSYYLRAIPLPLGL